MAVTDKRHVNEVWLQGKDEVLYERYKEKRNEVTKCVRVIQSECSES